jgi:hypothetical protein
VWWFQLRVTPKYEFSTYQQDRLKAAAYQAAVDYAMYIPVTEIESSELQWTIAIPLNS